jgi:hypothetical protein
MDDFVTVLTTSYPQQLWIVKGRLEAEGIECFVKDELTVQSYNLLSNAIGGVKLQVQKKDVEQANDLLFQLGYKKEEILHDDLLTQVNRKTVSIPILGKLSIVTRIVTITLLLVALLTVSIYYIVKPSDFEILFKQTWCVDKVYYKGNLVGPKTVNAISFEYSDGEISCDESATFDNNNGRLQLPGLNSTLISGGWKRIDNETIQLYPDTLKNVLEGVYEMDVSENQFILKSKTTTIYAHIDKTPTSDLFDFKR